MPDEGIPGAVHRFAPEIANRDERRQDRHVETGGGIPLEKPALERDGPDAIDVTAEGNRLGPNNRIEASRLASRPGARKRDERLGMERQPNESQAGDGELVARFVVSLRVGLQWARRPRRGRRGRW